MHSIAEWAQVLAEQVTPHETATASRVAEAYARGGRHRRRLMEESGALTGGFATPTCLHREAELSCGESRRHTAPGMAGDLVARFPAVLSAIHEAAPHLLALRASRLTNDLICCSHANLSDVIELAELIRATDVVEKSLRQAGISAEEAKLMALHVVDALLRDANNGHRFIQFITKKA